MDLMDSNDWPWSDEQKQKYTWGSLIEQGQNRENNDFYFRLYTVKNEGEYEPIFLSKSEQRTILKDFQVEGKIRIIEDEEPFPSNAELLEGAYESPDPNLIHVELLDKKKSRKSFYSHSIQSLADLMKDIDLRYQVRDLLVCHFNVYDVREIKRNQSTTRDVLEDKDELLLFMEELGFVKINWESLKRQTHRVIGNRYIQVQFFGEKAKQFADVLYGRKSVIRPKALEQVATLIKDLMSQNKLNEHFVQLGVPYSLLLDNQHSKHDMVYNVLLALASTGEQEDIDLLHKILAEFAHPLIFQGDTKTSVDFQYKVTKVIRYDGLSLFGGKVTAFDDSDTKRMEDLERQEHELSAGLMETIADVFGGNPFGQPQPKSQTKAQNTEVREEKTSSPTPIINIYNQNSVSNELINKVQADIKVENTMDDDLYKAQSPKFPHKIPSGITWNNVAIVFLDDKRIKMSVGGKEHTATYSELGLTGHGTPPKPSVVWTFFKVLAQMNGEIAISDPQAKDKYKKQKQLLSEFLQGYFSLEPDPFQPYKKVKSYKSKFTIFIDESASKKKEEASDTETESTTDDLDREIIEQLAQQAPANIVEDEDIWNR